MKLCSLTCLLMVLFASALPSPAEETFHYEVSVDTSSLVGHAAGPFYLSFQLTDGSATGNGSNAVVINNIEFAGGSAVGTAVISGGASGSLGEGVLVLTDTSFFNELYQRFNPGVSLTFQVHSSLNLEPMTPDAFSFSIFDGALNNLPTDGSGNQLLSIELDLPTIFSFGTTPDAPAGISIEAPHVQVVPEPTSLALGLSIVPLLGISRRRMRRRS